MKQIVMISDPLSVYYRIVILDVQDLLDQIRAPDHGVYRRGQMAGASILGR